MPNSITNFSIQLDHQMSPTSVEYCGSGSEADHVGSQTDTAFPLCIQFIDITRITHGNGTEISQLPYRSPSISPTQPCAQRRLSTPSLSYHASQLEYNQYDVSTKIYAIHIESMTNINARLIAFKQTGYYTNSYTINLRLILIVFSHLCLVLKDVSYFEIFR
jgi:hypothetical protein